MRQYHPRRSPTSNMHCESLIFIIMNGQQLVSGACNFVCALRGRPAEVCCKNNCTPHGERI